MLSISPAKSQNASGWAGTQANASWFQAGATNSPELASANPLRAWMRNGLLHIAGLTVGETLNIYGANGALIYKSVASSEEMDINLHAQGMYIVVSGDNSVKFINIH